MGGDGLALQANDFALEGVIVGEGATTKLQLCNDSLKKALVVVVRGVRRNFFRGGGRFRKYITP